MTSADESDTPFYAIPDQTPAEEAAREAADKLSKEQRVELRRMFLIRQMENPMFRDWLMEQLVALGAFANTFGLSPAGFPDPNATWFAAGQKAAGWYLWEIFDQAAPELASQMRREWGGPKP
jgi:hypothetical protein